MPNTTNFNFPTPADTDLVKDGASAIRSLGNSIDTAFVDLKGGTTGQVLAKASNTDLDFTWSAADPLSILDAKGDLISATAADTPARLAVGTNGQYLQADSTTATGLKWATVAAGSLTEIQSSTFTNQSTVSFTSIPTTYKELLFIFKNMSSSSDDQVRFQINGNSNSIYFFSRIGVLWSTSFSQVTSYQEQSAQQIIPTTNSADYKGFGYLRFLNPADTTFEKGWTAHGFNTAGSNSVPANLLSGGVVRTTSAITSVDIKSYNATNISGTVILYGVN